LSDASAYGCWCVVSFVVLGLVAALHLVFKVYIDMY
jgi:hypothetical protein